MAIAPAMVIIVGVVASLAVAGYRLMQPTVSQNPGVTAYQPPVATVLDPGWGARAVAVEAAANKVADAENQKLGLRPALLAQAQSTDAGELSGHAATPQQKAKTARTQKRQQDASAPGKSRVAERAPVAPFTLPQ